MGKIINYVLRSTWKKVESSAFWLAMKLVVHKLSSQLWKVVIKC